MGASPWFIVAAQAIITVYVLRHACIYLIGGDRKFLDLCLLTTTCALAALTSLPWFVSLLMPDVFAGILFLCAFLLAYADGLSLAQRIFLALILTISIAAHTSLFPIAALYFAALAIMKLAARPTNGQPSARTVMPWLLIPIMAATFWTSYMNYQLGLGFELSPSRNTFLMGRLFGDGLAPDFLRDNCPERQFISCRYLSNLPRSEKEFLFQHPLLQELKGHEGEMEAIVRGTILAYPVRFLISSARQTFLQFAALRTGDEIRSYAAKDWSNGAILHVFPGDLRAFGNSRQSRNRLFTARGCLRGDSHHNFLAEYGGLPALCVVPQLPSNKQFSCLGDFISDHQRSRVRRFGGSVRSLPKPRGLVDSLVPFCQCLLFFGRAAGRRHSAGSGLPLGS